MEREGCLKGRGQLGNLELISIKWMLRLMKAAKNNKWACLKWGQNELLQGSLTVKWIMDTGDMLAL